MAYTNEQMRDFVTDAEGEIDTLMAALQNGTISQDQWHDDFQNILGSYHLASFMLGQDDPEMKPDQIVEEAAIIQEQLEYLANFALVVGTAAEWGGDWFARARMYGSAINQSYWTGNLFGIPVPAQPGQGTQCLANCWCSWRIVTISEANRDYDCYWELDPQVEKHCQTCLQRSEDWYPIQIRNGILQV